MEKVRTYLGDEINDNENSAKVLFLKNELQEKTKN